MWSIANTPLPILQFFNGMRGGTVLLVVTGIVPTAEGELRRRECQQPGRQLSNLHHTWPIPYDDSNSRCLLVLMLLRVGTLEP